MYMSSSEFVSHSDEYLGSLVEHMPLVFQN